MTLYEQTKEFSDLQAMLSELEQEIPKDATEEEKASAQAAREVQEQAIHDTLEMVLMDIDDKIDGYCTVMKNLQNEANALKAEKLRIARMQASREKRIEQMRDMLKQTMVITNRSKVKSLLHTVTTSTKYKGFLDLPVELIPEEYQKKTVTADTTAIEKFLKAGNECGWAHLEPVNVLTIR